MPTLADGGFHQHPGPYRPQSPGEQFLNQFWNSYQQGVINPQLAAGNTQISSLLSQRDIAGTQSQMQQQGLQQQYGFDTQRLGLQNEQLGLNREQLQRQMGLLPQQNALQQQIFDIQQGQIERGQSNLESQYGLQQQQFGLRGEQLQNQYAQGQRGATSSAVSSGAINTAGYQQSLQDLAKQLSFGKSELGMAKQGAEQQYQSGKGQLADQLGFLNVNRQQNALGQGEREQQLRDQQRQLDLQAKGLGLSGQELGARLNNALQQLGLSNQLSAEQVTGEIAKIKNGEYSILSNIIPALSQFAGVNLFAG